MKTLPWYPRDMGKYARDTKHLSMLEHGAYNLLLDYYYSNGGLQAMLKHCSDNANLMPDHSRLYRICCAMTKQEQDAVDHVLNLFFKWDKKKGYVNSKADEVIDEQREKHKKRVEAGRKGGTKKSASNAKAMLKQSSSKENKNKNNTPLPPTGGTEFNVLDCLIQVGRDAVSRNAPGWCINELARVYNGNINSGAMDMPTRPNDAFPAWCLSYTRGKPPQ